MSGFLVWWCGCCLRFKFSPEEIEQRYKSQEIDRMLEKDRQAFRRQVKLLLLGAGESGKSTFLKQMRIIHGIKFEPELVKEYQHVIYQNIIKGMKVLIDARDKLNIPWENSRNYDIGYQLLKFENTMILDARLFLHYVPNLQSLWKDIAIKKAFDRRREFQLSDSVQYFLDSLDRIARLEGEEYAEKEIQSTFANNDQVINSGSSSSLGSLTSDTLPSTSQISSSSNVHRKLTALTAPKRVKIAKTAQENNTERVLQELREIANKLDTPTDDDEFDCFGKSVAIQLKKLSESLALQSMAYIQSYLIHQRLQNSNDNNSYLMVHNNKSRSHSAATNYTYTISSTNSPHNKDILSQVVGTILEYNEIYLCVINK